jgi:uncharacterized membrane protein (DUF2068 family)
METMPAAHSIDPRSGPQPLPQRGRSAGASQTRRRDGTLLRIIAVLKFLKAASLIALSVGVFRTMHQDIGTRLEHWIKAMHLDPGNRHIEMFLERVSNLSPAQVKRLGLVGLLYAGLFLVEGTGLWLQRRWGEWATVVITGLLIPVEVYEIFRHPSAAKILLLIVNMAVVGYLVYRIRNNHETG